MDIVNKKKKLIYLSAHRGTKEADIIIGDFVRHYLNNEFQDLDLLEEFLQESDFDLLNWLSDRNNNSLPAKYQNLVGAVPAQ